MSLASHFKPKSLMFYGSLIGSVMVLFWFITRYGEAKLVAPPNLSGRYVDSRAQATCPPDRRLVLTLQQSGVFLNGVLTVETLESLDAIATEPKREQRSTLSGRWEEPQIQLSGTAPALAVCNNQDAVLDAAPPVALAGTITTGSAITLTGKIDVEAESWAFSAQREAIALESTNH